MASLQFYLRESITNSKGQHPVYLRITARQRSRYSSLDIWIKKKQWNPGKQEIRKTQNINDDAAMYNEVLAEVRASFMRIMRRHQAQNKLRSLRNQPAKPLTIDKLKRMIFNDHQDAGYPFFFEYARAENKKIQNQDRYNTFKRKRAAINKFEQYILDQHQISGQDIPFSQISIGLLKAYHTYLTEVIGNHPNTAKKDIQEIGTFFGYAIKNEVIPLQHNPFDHVSFPYNKRKKTFLTSVELQKIIHLPLKKNSLLWHVRNYFFFQIYTAGLRVSDLCVVEWDAITGLRFEYTMRKTNRHKSLVLVPPALTILDKYDPVRSNELIFPILHHPKKSYSTKTSLDKEIGRKTALINKYLKKIETQAGLKKHITTHIARHTFANMALQDGWSKEKIQKALAHKSVRTTEKYLASFEDYNIDTDLKKLFKDKSWAEKMMFAA